MPWREMFLFEGTMRRGPFIWTLVLSFPVFWIAIVFGIFTAVAIPVMRDAVIFLAALGASTLSLLSSSAARLRDMGHSPWLVVLHFVPLVNLALVLALVATPTHDRPTARV